MTALPKLQRNTPITEGNLPSQEFHFWWQQVADSLTTSIDGLAAAVLDIQEALDGVDDAKRLTARVNSYTVPTDVLTAVDAGATATITIAAHQRVYSTDSGLSIPTVSVLTADITGLAFATLYYVYYDDATLADTTPTFTTTTTAATAQVGAGSSRHFLGYITTPVDGGGGTGGDGGTPPGGGPIP